jgi:serine/threonine protein kinase
MGPDVMEGAERRIGRYVVEEELGRGMMGVVFRARDPELGRTVALKTVQVAFAATPEEQESFERRFLAEARAAARLSHPNIVVVHDVGRDPEAHTLFIAFEHLRGRTLAEVAQDGPLEWREAVRITAQVARALHHAHGQGIVHRDVKPANVMLLPSGEPKVMDFGIAKVPAERLTSTGQFFGTPSYMSPEQASAELIDGRSDLFSLAAVLYLLLTARPAFEADSVPATLTRVLFRDPPPASSLVVGLPASLDRVLAKALAKRPPDRYPDASAFAADLEAVLAGRAPAASAESSPQATLVSRAVPSSSLPHAAEPGSGVPETSAPAAPLPLPRWPQWPASRRSLIAAVGGLALLAVLLASGMGVPSLGRASVELNLEHSLRGGVARVFVDERLVLEEKLESWVKEDLVVMKVRRGRLTQAFSVPAGERVLRVEVEGDGFRGSRTLDGRFAVGEARRLEARVGGLVKKELSAWLAPAKSS